MGLRKTSKIFNWYSIFDNTLTIDRGNYLKDVVTSLLYTSNWKQIYWHRHILWFSNFDLNRMLNSEHLYFDGTFITTKEFYQ